MEEIHLLMWKRPMGGERGCAPFYSHGGQKSPWRVRGMWITPEWQNPVILPQGHERGLSRHDGTRGDLGLKNTDSLRDRKERGGAVVSEGIWGPPTEPGSQWSVVQSLVSHNEVLSSSQAPVCLRDVWKEELRLTRLALEVCTSYE